MLTGAPGEPPPRTDTAAQRDGGVKRRSHALPLLGLRPQAAAILRCVAAVVLGLLTVCPVPATAAPPLPASASSLFHANLIRTVDLSTGGNVRETISLAVENSGKQAVSAYHVVIPLARAGNVAHFSCTDKKTGLKLDMREGDTILSAPQGPLPVDRSGSLITFGPYGNVSAFSEEPLLTHFESLKGIVAAKSLLREIEISHWGGNAAVEEHYHFVHGQFRRVDYQLYSHVQHLTSVVQSLNLVLPLSARNPYYRDEIGNVSTSNFRLESVRDRSLLQLRPRYPLYGGWNYTCYLGYNMPLDEVVRVPKQADGKGKGRYTLRAPF
ncbi:MAG: Ribophorin I-domain-containing protein, partial [Olpidium bornovanus]